MAENPGRGVSQDDGFAGDAPQVVVQRLPLYARILAQLASEGAEMVSSEQLATQLRMTPAQIRKDLSYFGRFGKQGRGYNVHRLASELRSILGLDRVWNAALVGVGRLGHAIVNYPGFAPAGFVIVAAFDTDEAIVGTHVGNLMVASLDRIATEVPRLDIDIGIVAVPDRFAQQVISQLVDSGVRAILNYAPIAPKVPDGVVVRGVDPVLALQSMTYYLKAGEESRAGGDS